MAQLNPQAVGLADKRFHMAHPEFSGRQIIDGDPDHIKEHWIHLYKQALREVEGDDFEDDPEDEKGVSAISEECPRCVSEGEDGETLQEKEQLTSKSWDLFLQCEHPFENYSRTAFRPKTYEIVPRGPQNPLKLETTFGDISTNIANEEKDKLFIYYRDDDTKPPGMIRLVPQAPSKAEVVEARQSLIDNGYTVYEAELSFDRSVMGYLSIDNMMTVSSYKTRYKIEEIPRPTPNIDVYCPDEWSLSISLPAFKSIKQGVKATPVKRNSTTNPGQVIHDEAAISYQEVKGWSNGSSSRELSTYYNRQRSETFSSNDSRELTIANVGKGFTLSRNGVLVKPGEVITAAIAFLKAGQQTMDIIQHIQDMVPKVGYYIEASLQVCQGSLKISWGRKEYQHWQTFAWLEIDASMKLIDFSFEVGVGAKGVRFVAQVFANLSVSLALTIKGAVSGPDANKLNIPLTRQDQYTFGVRVEVGKYLELGANIQTGFDGTVELQVEWAQETKWNISGKLIWKGLKANLFIGGKMGTRGAKVQEDVTLIEPIPIINIVYPKPEKYNPPYLTDQEIESEIIKELDQVELRVNYTDATGVIGVMPKRQLAVFMLKKFGNRPIKRDKKTIEALTKEARAILLRDYATERNFFVRMVSDNYLLTDDAFLRFLDTDYKEILSDTNYHDQLIEFKGN